MQHHYLWVGKKIENFVIKNSNQNVQLKSNVIANNVIKNDDNNDSNYNKSFKHFCNL